MSLRFPISISPFFARSGTPTHRRGGTTPSGTYLQRCGRAPEHNHLHGRRDENPYVAYEPADVITTAWYAHSAAIQ